MAYEIILTKSDVQTLKYFAEQDVAGGRPSFLDKVFSYSTATVMGAYLINAEFGAVATAYDVIKMALETSVESMTYTQRSGHLNAYTTWLNTMNNNNFTAIKVQPYNYRLVAEGVNFTADIPNVLGYKNSSGNWIEIN